VIALSIALLPFLQVLKAKRVHLQKPYVLLPVYTREYGLESFQVSLKSQQLLNTTNTTRQLLMLPSQLPQPIVPLPPWDPSKNVWKVKRLGSEHALLFVSLNVNNVSYYLDLDFRGQLIWINCKWKPEDKQNTWTMWVEKFKPNQLHVSR